MEAAVTIRRECRDAGYTMRAVAHELSRRGCTTRSGSAWRFEYVRSILRQAA